MIGRVIAGRGGGAVGANMTPMIDVVFLLIIFFMLVAQISRQRTIELDLPRIEESESRAVEGESRTVVNVVPEGLVGRYGGDYRLGGTGFAGTADGLAGLREALREAVGRRSESMVLIRASRAESYERVYPAMRAAGEAGASRVELVMLREGGR